MEHTENTEHKFCLEVAEKEFDRFTEAMDLDVDCEKMDEDDLKGFQSQKNIILLAIQKGDLSINENGEPVFTPTRSNEGKPITFYEPTGATVMAMDKKKKSQEIAKQFAMMAEMTQTSPSTFSKMKYVDLKVCTAITVLFMG